MSDDTAIEEVDPFVKRVVTVKPEDVVIFRFPKSASDQDIRDARESLTEKMGQIPFIVIREDIDLTVLKRSESTRQIHIA